jgi:hypothetical protein
LTYNVSKIKTICTFYWIIDYYSIEKLNNKTYLFIEEKANAEQIIQLSHAMWNSIFTYFWTSKIILKTPLSGPTPLYNKTPSDILVPLYTIFIHYCSIWVPANFLHKYTKISCHINFFSFLSLTGLETWMLYRFRSVDCFIKITLFFI